MTVFAQAGSSSLFASTLLWGLMIAAVGFGLIVTNRAIWIRRLGQLLSVIGLAVLAAALFRLAPLAGWPEQAVFWLLSLTAVGGAAAAVAARSPVYTAIWFAYSLLGVAGLFLQQRAHFLGLATIVVYAGAIVVTFLFVLMLAQPRGESTYDRLGWTTHWVSAAVISATALAATVLLSFDAAGHRAGGGQAELAHANHMARLGAELFTKQLVAVELAGTLLLVALVGAIAIVIQSRSAARPAVHGVRVATGNADPDRSMGDNG